MSDRDEGTVFLAAFMVLVLVATAGFFVGRWTARGVVETRKVEGSAPGLTTLRCTVNQQTGKPTEWGTADTDSALHHARMSLETARMYTSAPLKQAWASEAIAGFMLVEVCRGAR